MNANAIETIQRLMVTPHCDEDEARNNVLTEAMKAIAALSQKQEAEREKPQKLIHVGYTNPAQIGYAKDESGSFYPDTENECYIPLYMLKIHENRLGHDYTAPPSTAQEPAIYGLKSALSGTWDGHTTVKASDADLYDSDALIPLYKHSQPTAQGVEEWIDKHRVCRNSEHNPQLLVDAVGKCDCANLIPVEDLRTFLSSQPTAQDGMVMVPVVATREIENAIAKSRNLKASEIWEDAIKAANKGE